MIYYVLALIFALASAGAAQAQCANGQCAVPQRTLRARVVQLAPRAQCANGQCRPQQSYRYAPRVRQQYVVPRQRFYFVR